MIDTATVTGANAGVYTYEYDTRGRRVRKTMQGGSSTFYLYDAFDQLVAEYVQAAGQSAPALAREYYYANGVLIGAADIAQSQQPTNPFGCSSGGKKFWKKRMVRASSPAELAWLLVPLAGCLILPRWRRYDQRGKIRLAAVVGVAGLGGLILLAAAGRSHASGTTTVTTYTPYRVHTDQLGAPIKMTDENGAVVWTATYEPFGAIAAGTPVNGQSGDPVLNVRRPGQYYDAETGLYYNWHRYYDPVAGRYLEPDAIFLTHHVPVSVYGYMYALNNPLVWVDSQGLWTLAFGFGFGGRFGLGGNVQGGFVIDGHLNLGLIGTLAGQVGPKADVGALNVFAHASNADTIMDLGGMFKNVDVGLGAGLDVQLNGFTGRDASDSADVVGAGFAVGVGLGGGGSIGPSVTGILPLFPVTTNKSTIDEFAKYFKNLIMGNRMLDGENCP